MAGYHDLVWQFEPIAEINKKIAEVEADESTARAKADAAFEKYRDALAAGKYDAVEPPVFSSGPFLERSRMLVGERGRAIADAAPVLLVALRDREDQLDGDAAEHFEALDQIVREVEQLRRTAQGLRLDGGLERKANQLNQTCTTYEALRNAIADGGSFVGDVAEPEGAAA